VSRIVRASYRYKRPPRRKKPVALEVPVVVRTADPAKAHTRAKEASKRPLLPAVVTARRPTAFASLPPGLLPDTPGEHWRRGDATDALFRDIVHRIAGEDR
jgi:hypothetical protein